MATQDVIKTLTIRSKTEGVQESTAALKGLASAHDGVAKSAASSATVTETSAKSQLSLADAVARAERRFNSALRAQQDFEKLQRQMNAAVAQNPALQERANAVLALAAQHFGNVSKAQQAASVVAQDFASRLSSVTGAAGSVGSVLSALGPIGIGLAATFGGVVLALNAMSNAAHELAEKAQELRRFSEITGLTTAQVQALRSEASKFGVTSDEAQTAIQNFTARFNELRLGQGELLTQIRRVNPALADQMAGVTNAGDALTLFSQALAKVDDVFQRNALVKAATGRGGLSAAAFLSNLNVDALTKSYVEAGKGLDDNLIKKTAQLEIDIKKTSAAASLAIASIFSESALQTELAYQKGWLDFANAVKNFSLSGDLRFLLETVLKVKFGGQGTLLGAMGIDYEAGYKAPIITPRRVTGPEVTAPLNLTGGAADRNDPLRRELAVTAEYITAKLKDQIGAMGEAATFAQKLELAQRELAISGKAAGLSAEQMAKAQDVLKGSFALQQMQATISALGGVATPTEQYQLRVAELTQTLARGTISQETFNRAVAGLKAEQSLQFLSEMVSTLGAAATPAEQLKLKFAELEQKLATGKITLDTFNRSIADFQREQDVTKLRNNVSALGSAATAAEQYRLRIAELQQQLDRGQISQETFNRAVAAANPLMNQLKDISKDFLTTAAHGFLDAKAGTDSLSKSFEALSLRLADKALEQFMSGEWEKAAVSAIMAVVSALISLVSHTNDLKHTIDLLDRLNQLRLRQVQATSDTSTLEGQLAVFNANAVLEMVEEMRKGGELLTALIQVQNLERQRIIEDFNKQAVAAEKQLADERLKRIQSAQDRLFAAANDNTTLEGQLAAQARQFERERLDETTAGGAAMTDLLAAQQAEELALRKSFNDKAVEETKRAAQEQYEAIRQAARNIVDYVNNLNVGSESALSPGARLSAAQSTYNATLTLAQANNADALNRITQDAENLRKALQSVYASGSGYQSGLAAIQSQLLALPAVTTATDPVVTAILDTLKPAVDAVAAAVGGTTTAVGGVTTAVGGTTTAVGGTTSAVTGLDDSGTVIFQMKDFTSRVVTAINNHGAMSVAGFNNLSEHLAAIRAASNYTAFHPGGPFNAGFAEGFAGTAGGFSYTAAAQGGTIPPYGLGLVSEHLNPTWVRAGSEPITVSPYAPANDNRGGSGANNREVVAELRALRAEVAALKREIGEHRKDTKDGAAMVAGETAALREVEEKGWRRSAGAAGR